MEGFVKILTDLVASEACAKPMEKPLDAALPQSFWELLYKVAKAQDLAHLVGSALSNQNAMPEGEIAKKLEKQMLTAVYRYQRLHYEYMRMCDTLEGAGIPFVPLKGSVIRAYYPESWMRTSCDVDILVHEQDLDRAVEALCTSLDYRAEEERHYHDISLYSPSGIHLELHFNILESMENIDGLLSRVWEFCSPAQDRKYEHRQSNEYLVFHSIAHMSYHFIMGGCGIRPFLDLYLLKHKMGYDEKTVRSYCRECGLERFYDAALEMSEIWFGGQKPTALCKEMESYLLSGGIYGTRENVIAMEQERKGGKGKYLVGRIFMPYSDLRLQYPILKRHKLLYPFCLICRWGRLLFGGRMASSVRELKMTRNIDTDRAKAMSALFREVGL